MFFQIDEIGPDGNPPNGTPGGPPLEGPRDFGFFFLLVVNNFILFVTIVLNIFVPALIVTHRKKSLGTPFYAMTAVLMVILFIADVVIEINQILFVGWNIRGGEVQWLTTLANIYTSYCSVILIWLLGLNRMAIFVYPRLNEFLFTRKNLAVLLIILVVAMVFVTIWFSRLIGMNVGNGQAFATNMRLLYIINLISYGIPLSCCLFYVKLYWYMRKNRENSGKTAYDTLYKAEINTAIQGVVILLTYLSSMFMLIAMGKLPKDGDFKRYMSRVRELVEALPQLVVPLSTILFSKEMQRLVRSALYIPKIMPSKQGSVANRK